MISTQTAPTRLNFSKNRITKRKVINRMRKAGLRYLLVYNSPNVWRYDESFYLACNDVKFLDSIVYNCWSNPLQGINLSYVEKIN
jgi:hypothetical protein